MGHDRDTDHGGDSDMRHEDERRGWRAAYLVLIGLTVAVGVVTFTLSFVGLRDYGIRVEGLSPWLAPLVPIGVDVLSLCGVAATYLLRCSRARVRAYAWLVFGVAVALSVAGNLTHAVARHLSPAGMVGAAAWPILLALASHLVIVTRRALDRDTATPVSLGATPAVAPVAARAVGHTLVSDRSTSGAFDRSDPDGSAVAAVAGRVASQGDNDIIRQRARHRVAAGEPCDPVAQDLGVSKKSVERWTRDIREARRRGAATVATAGA